MPTLTQIGPRRFVDVESKIVHVLNPSPNISRIVEAASPDDLAAVGHLTWWLSPAAIGYRTGIKIEHPTGLVSRWSLAESTQGRWWIVLEVWAEANAATPSKQTIPRHLSPSLHAAQLDGVEIECMRRAA